MHFVGGIKTGNAGANGSCLQCSGASVRCGSAVQTGTKGYAGYLVWQFFRTHVGDVVLSCWDENAESFWRHMAKKHGRTVRKIGYSLEGNVKLLLREA